jgi:plastocyanin
MKTLINKLLVLCATAIFLNASAGTVSVQVVDKTGKPLPDAVIVLLPFNKNAKPSTPLPMQTTIAQEKMQFLPLVTVVPVGAKISFVNNDAWNHHVRGYSADPSKVDLNKSSGFALLLEGKADGRKAVSKDVMMDKAEVLGASLLGCFIHGSMRGYIYVTDSPWASKTNADGMAQFTAAPDGPMQVKVWQADLLVDVSPVQLEVTSNGVTKHVFQLPVTPRRVRATSTPSSGYAY